MNALNHTVTTTPYQATVALQNAAADPTRSVWLAASAGTGKTKVLTDRLLRLLLAGNAPQNMLCLTYTKAAAAEMANRLFDTLRKWVTLPRDELYKALADIGLYDANEGDIDRARELFALVLDCPGGLHIQTLHSFCQELLQRFPLEAGLVPNFVVLDDMQASALRTQSVGQLLKLVNSAVDKKLSDAFAVLLATVGEHGLRQVLAEDVSQWRFAAPEDVAVLLDVETTTTRTATLAKVCTATDEWRADLLAAAQVYLASDKPTQQTLGQKMANFLAAPNEARCHMWDEYVSVFHTDGRLKVMGTLCPNTLCKKLPRLPDIMTLEAERLLRAVESVNAATVFELTCAFNVVMAAYQSLYRCAKQQQAVVDYYDLISSTEDLLTQAMQAAWVRYKLDHQLQHVLVDEAQDTSPAQWAILRALVDDFVTPDSADSQTRTLFVVGDEKQSIYSFQGAAPHLFAAERIRYQKLFHDNRQPFETAALSLSFRSTQAVLDIVNKTFAAQRLNQIAARTDAAGVVELWPLIPKTAALEAMPWALPVQRVTEASPQQLLASRLTTTIKDWLESNTRLPARDKPISAGDVMILVQKRGTLMETLVRALKDQQVPVAGVDKLILGEQLVVQDMLALVHFVLLPTDDLNLAALLKTPLCGVDEETLFNLCFARTGTLWQRVQQQLPNVAAYLDGFRQLRTMRPYEFLQRALRNSCAVSKLTGLQAFRARMGDEVLDPLHELLQTALTFEASNSATLQGFVRALAQHDIVKKRELSEAAGKVRVMTVHASKGLQAPIVILADTADVPSPSKQPRLLSDMKDSAMPSLYVPTKALDVPVTAARRVAYAALRDAEYNRLLYVAMTRAEDKLIVAGIAKKADGSASEDSWYAQIAAAFAEVSHSLADDILLYATGSPATGTAEETAKSFDSVPLPAWALLPVESEPALARPLSPSRLMQSDVAYASPLMANDKRFTAGLVTHRLLEVLPGKTSTQQNKILQHTQASYAAEIPAERWAVIQQEVQAILQYPEFADLFGPSSRAEVPLVGVVDGEVVSGQVDRLLVTDESVLVVDYKTNRPPPKSIESVAPAYIDQMRLYGRLLQKIYPGRIVKAALLWTDGPHFMPVPAGLL